MTKYININQFYYLLILIFCSVLVNAKEINYVINVFGEIGWYLLLFISLVSQLPAGIGMKLEWDWNILWPCGRAVMFLNCFINLMSQTYYSCMTISMFNNELLCHKNNYEILN